MGKRAWTRCKAFLRAHLSRKGQEVSRNSDLVSSMTSSKPFVKDDDDIPSISKNQQGPRTGKQLDPVTPVLAVEGADANVMKQPLSSTCSCIHARAGEQCHGLWNRSDIPKYPDLRRAISCNIDGRYRGHAYHAGNADDHGNHTIEFTWHYDEYAYWPPDIRYHTHCSPTEELKPFPHVPLEIRDLIIEYRIMSDLLPPLTCLQCPGSLVLWRSVDLPVSFSLPPNPRRRYLLLCFGHHESRTTYFRILENLWTTRADEWGGGRSSWKPRDIFGNSTPIDHYRRLLARLLNLMLLDKATFSSILRWCSRCLIPAMEEIMLNVKDNVPYYDDQHVMFYSMYVWLRNLCLYEQRLSRVPLSRRRLTPVEMDFRHRWSDLMIIKSLHEPEESHI